MIYYLKRHGLIVAIIVLVFIGFLLLQRQPGPEAENAPLLATDVIQEDIENLETADDEASQLLIIDIKGAIAAPGVYHLEPDARIVDAIEMAGGFTDQADEKQVNLAQRIHDEMFLYIPQKGEESVTVADMTATAGNTSDVASEKIRINQATLDDLVSLNGIGPSKAQAILDYMEEHGPFQEIGDLIHVTGIGEKTLENLEDDIIIP